jgi:hypothetical protein
LKNFQAFILLSFSSLIVSPAIAQTSASGNSEIKNAISTNVGQYFINEINFGYEHFISEKNSFEINAGYIYRNDFLLDLTDEWIQSQYFRERGFALRAYYKTYKKSGDKNNNKTFYSFGLNYQYLHFEDEWLETGKPFQLDSTINTVPQNYFNPKAHKSGPEQILMSRLRHRIGIQLLLGNVIPMGSNFFLEVYYGLGLRGIFSRRTDTARITTIDSVEYFQDLNYVDNQFYVRPTIHAGVKIKLGW